MGYIHVDARDYLRNIVHDADRMLADNISSEQVSEFLESKMRWLRAAEKSQVYMVEWKLSRKNVKKRKIELTSDNIDAFYEEHVGEKISETKRKDDDEDT